MVLILVLILWKIISPSQKTNNENKNILFAPEIENILSIKIELIKSVFDNKIIIEAIEKANEKNKNISQKQIAVLDNQWIVADQNDSFIKSFSSGPAALALLEFKKTYPEFSEIFVTDIFGLNVAQTNKTSDFYQADENWWIKSYNNGSGQESHGEIEFDESSQKEAISVYIPIKNSEDQVIGIAKAVINIAFIKSEL